MKTTMTKPCAHCPFRHDIPGYLHAERAEEIGESVTTLQQSFPCHETTTFEDDDYGDAFGNVRVPTDKEQHCAGAMIMLEHMEQPNQWMRWMERLGMYDRHKLSMDAPVFTDVEDFKDHHDG